jgi:hypothetical protein
MIAKKLIFAFCALSQCINVNAETGYPGLKLENELITAHLYLPDATKGYYRGTRFDWSGIIGRVEFAGHVFYAPLHKNHNPEGHDFVSGPAEEFAMFNPMGFDEAEPGESFVKIGVGLLEKGAEDEYLFHADYKIIRVGEWQVEHGSDWVNFSQDLVGDRGWAYRYSKSIKLVPERAEFVIQHRLENAGEKTIDINHYNHNFTIIDDVPYGPDYSVEFPFSTEQAKPINDLAWFRQNRIEVLKPLQDNSLWIPVFEGDGSADDNAALVRNNKTGAAVRFKGDTPITRMVFWAVEAAASPEPFIHIKLGPGEVQQWASHYSFSVDAVQ